jgi:DNA replication protein DnaC
VSDPAVAVINREGTEPGEIEDNLRAAAREVTERVPALYTDAVVTIPEVRGWVTELVASAATERPYAPIQHGRSLVLSGPTGTGKTWNSYGAVRALAVSGARCSWRVINTADMYALLRPSPHRNSEDELDALKTVTLLVIDDLGAAKDSPWCEEVLYRLVNHRSEHIRPTLITTNMVSKPGPGVVHIRDGLSDRVFSRIAGMASWVAVQGQDHRLTAVGE